MERGRMLPLLLMVCIAFSAVYAYESFSSKSSPWNVSAIQTAPFTGVYWDQNCTNNVLSIDWGNITSGTSKTISLFVRNEGNDTFVLVLQALNWVPSIAATYMSFSWQAPFKKLAVGQVANVLITLLVSPAISGVTTFSFDISFDLKTYYLGDVNFDGVVDVRDAFLVASAFGSSPGMPNWSSSCDINKDGTVNIRDYFTVCQEYGSGV